MNDQELTNSLTNLGVYFLARGDTTSELAVSPDSLLVDLARHHHARFRLALIPLFLTRPDFADLVQIAMRQLDKPAQITLSCYYHAAHFLRQKNQNQLTEIFGYQPLLPNLFEANLAFDGVTADENLHQLANQHAVLTNRFINWYGTYEHAFQRLIKTQLFQQN